MEPYWLMEIVMPEVESTVSVDLRNAMSVMFSRTWQLPKI